MVGSYVVYKGSVYLVVEDTGGMVKILNALEGQCKLHVANRNVQPTRYRPATQVEYRGNSYLVTAKALIISLVTGRVMKWDETHQERHAILALAGQ